MKYEDFTKMAADISPETLEKLQQNLSSTADNSEEESTVDDIEDNMLEDIEKDRENAFDDIEDLIEYKRTLRQSTLNQIAFKEKARGCSIWGFVFLTIFLLLNLFILIYLPGVKVPLTTHVFPKVDAKVILIITTATFVNVFTVINLLFKYIFSPTNDLLTHNRDLSRK